MKNFFYKNVDKKYIPVVFSFFNNKLRELDTWNFINIEDFLKVHMPSYHVLDFQTENFKYFLFLQKENNSWRYLFRKKTYVERSNLNFYSFIQSTPCSNHFFIRNYAVDWWFRRRFMWLPYGREALFFSSGEKNRRLFVKDIPNVRHAPVYNTSNVVNAGGSIGPFFFSWKFATETSGFVERFSLDRSTIWGAIRERVCSFGLLSIDKFIWNSKKVALPQYVIESSKFMWGLPLKKVSFYQHKTYDLPLIPFIKYYNRISFYKNYADLLYVNKTLKPRSICSILAPDILPMNSLSFHWLFKKWSIYFSGTRIHYDDSYRMDTVHNLLFRKYTTRLLKQEKLLDIILSTSDTFFGDKILNLRVSQIVCSSVLPTKKERPDIDSFFTRPILLYWLIAFYKPDIGNRWPLAARILYVWHDPKLDWIFLTKMWSNYPRVLTTTSNHLFDCNNLRTSYLGYVKYVPIKIFWPYNDYNNFSSLHLDTDRQTFNYDLCFFDLLNRKKIQMFYSGPSLSNFVFENKSKITLYNVFRDKNTIYSWRTNVFPPNIFWKAGSAIYSQNTYTMRTTYLSILKPKNVDINFLNHNYFLLYVNLNPTLWVYHFFKKLCFNKILVISRLNLYWINIYVYFFTYIEFLLKRLILFNINNLYEFDDFTTNFHFVPRANNSPYQTQNWLLKKGEPFYKELEAEALTYHKKRSSYIFIQRIISVLNSMQSNSIKSIYLFCYFCPQKKFTINYVFDFIFGIIYKCYGVESFFSICYPTQTYLFTPVKHAQSVNQQELIRKINKFY